MTTSILRNCGRLSTSTTLNLLNKYLILICRYAPMFPVLIMLASCNSKLKIEKVQQTLITPFSGFLLQSQHNNAFQLRGDFATNPAAEQFINKMISKHGFKRQELYNIFSQAKHLNYVLSLVDRKSPSEEISSSPNGTWLRYRNQFITADNIQNGMIFWNQNEDTLNRAWKIYGVPPEIIVGIIGVETRWGSVMGKTRILDALATLSFNYSRRSGYFSSELETFLLMVYNEKINPFNLKGSFTGAMGYGQFMPSSYKVYAVDFDGDNHINLWDPVDTIGSIANYLKVHGWVKDGTVAVQVNEQPQRLANDFKINYSISQLAASGLTPMKTVSNHKQVKLLQLDIGTGYQYWLGLPNFYTIISYNHSIYYAMAVWQLGQAVALARTHGLSPS